MLLRHSLPCTTILILLLAGLCRAADKPQAFDPEPVVALLELVLESSADAPDLARESLAVLANKVQSGELSTEQVEALRPRLQPMLDKVLAMRDHPLRLDAALLSASWRDPSGIKSARSILDDAKQPTDARLKAFDALVAAGDSSVIESVARILGDAKSNSPKFRAAVLTSLSRCESPKVAEIVLAGYAKLEPDLQPKAIELLTQRPAWSKPLLAAMARGEVPKMALNANQAARLLGSRDDELVRLVTTTWGTVRTERNPQREQVVTELRELLRRTPGDSFRGEAVFKRLCAQCHKIYGEGHDVGPDLTANGRSSFEQLLSNVFDPSLVIGESYLPRTVITADGRSLTGLLVEDNDQRIVLKQQGGKVESIARDDVEEVITSQLSMMPEDIEKQFKPQEIADLFAFLMLDKHPSDPSAKRLPDIKESAPSR